MRRFVFSLTAPTLLAAGLLASGVAHADPPKIAVFFSEWSAALDDVAMSAVSSAADQAKAQPKAPVTVAGFASTIGSKEANDLLAKLRAQVVIDQLVQDGVPASRIRRVGHGATPYSFTPLESRRIEITIGR
jgi:outer membrane protein OmpA-like peptidoglycan-associated protein